MEVRERYNAEKRELFALATALSDGVVNQISLSLRYAEEGRRADYEEVIRESEGFKQKCLDLDEKVARIIALEQPVASDLRLFVTYIKIGSYLSRISTHARRLAKASDQIDRALFNSYLPSIRLMVNQGLQMLKSTSQALSQGDVGDLSGLGGMDSLIDQEYKKASAQIVALLKKGSVRVEDGAALITLLRFLERFGDHVTNIAESVYFARHGRHVELND